MQKAFNNFVFPLHIDKIIKTQSYRVLYKLYLT